MRHTRLLSIIEYAVFSGPHNHDLRLYGALAERGVATTVLLPEAPGDANARLRAAGLPIITYRTDPARATRSETLLHARYLINAAKNIKNLRRIIKEQAIDLVQLADPFHPHAAIAAKLERRPLVVHLVGMGGSLAARLMGGVITCRLADVIMTNGDYTRTAFPGLPRRNPMVSYFSPVDIGAFKPDIARRKAARAECGLKADDIAIGYIGRLHPEKDHPTCVRALALIRERWPKVRLVMMGSVDQGCSDYMVSIWRIAAALGLRPGKDVIHKDAGARVADLAQSFDVCWSMGYQEGATSSVGEAMAMGIPVVGAGNSAVREMIEEGVSGFLVGVGQSKELARVTSLLIEHQALRVKMGQAARERAVKLFSTDICAAKHLEAYDVALSGVRGTSRESTPAEHSVRGSNEHMETCDSLGQAVAVDIASEPYDS